MKDLVVIKDQENLRYISELFNANYNNLELRKEDLQCIPQEEMKLLVQPRSVTYTRLRASPSLEHVFREAVRCLQSYMVDSAKSIILMRERFNFIVNIDMSQVPHVARHPDRIEKFCRDLEKLRFVFEWDQREFKDDEGAVHPAVKYSYSGIIFIGHVKRSDSGVFGIHVNPMAVPYLTFIGKEMGRTQFDSDVLNALDTQYCKRLYLFLCDWAARGGLMQFSLEDFKDMVGITEKYTYSQVRRRLLDVMTERLDELGSDVRFTFTEVYDPESKRRPRVAGIEFFSFYTKQKVSIDVVKRALTSCIGAVADKERRGLVEETVDKIVLSGQASRLLNKFKYYAKKMEDGSMKETEYKNTLLKIIRENFGVELRSELHVRNANRSSLISVEKVTSQRVQK